ncbi:carbohydrate ABC transporter permease [Candidatus Aerophobetes bacterium]|nr:carbohydrate ABC transporter permease [Candidatus Aerophobetes bacterium]
MKKIKKINWIRVGIYAFLILFIIISLFPLFWMLDTSFKSDEEVFKMPPVWFPSPVRLENYRIFLLQRPFVKYTLNSLIVALSVSALCIGLGAPAAYGFSRFRFRGNRLMFGAILSSRLVPPISFIVPFTMIFSWFKMIDTLQALIIAYIFFNLPFVIWILSGFFKSIPQELDDAARIDGCNNITAFWKVILPIARPGVIAGTILTFLMCWNEFLFALVLTRLNAKTLPIGLYDFFADGFIRANWLAAATIYTLIPAIVFVLFFQKHLIKGILAGAVKA